MTTTTFKPGDRVRLTGKSWSNISATTRGDIVTIARIDADGDPTFVDSDGGEWYILDDGYEAEMVEPAPTLRLTIPTCEDVQEAILAAVKQAANEKTSASWLNEPVDEAGFELPPVSEYRDPRHESLLREINSQAAVIRRRNETIEQLQEKVAEQERAIQQWETRWSDEVEEAGVITREPVLKAGAMLREGLRDAAERVYQVNSDNGWFEEDRTVGDDVALLHSEASEMLEAFRDWGLEDATKQEPGAKPEGFGSECADVLVRLLDTCKRRGIDLPWEFERKLAHNKSRGYRHGGKKL